jgi:hypothetical protein
MNLNKLFDDIMKNETKRKIIETIMNIYPLKTEYGDCKVIYENSKVKVINRKNEEIDIDKKLENEIFHIIRQIKEL